MDDDDDAHLRVTMNELYPQEVNSSKLFHGLRLFSSLDRLCMVVSRPTRLLDCY